MPLWKAALARSKPNSCTKLVIHPGMLPGVTCLPTSKDITIASGFILPSGISPLNRQNAAPLDPVSTKSGEGHVFHAMPTDNRLGPDDDYGAKNAREPLIEPN